MKNRLEWFQNRERLCGAVTKIVVLALWLWPPAMAQTRNTASTNKVKSFDHLVINVSDMERALAFYKRLGFTLINEDGWRRGQGQVSIRIGENQKINIHKQDVVGPQNKPEDIGPNDKFSLAYIPLAGGADFCVVWGGTIQEAQQHLRDSGVDHISAPRNVMGARGPATSVYFRDPDGNLWEFMVYP